MGYMYQRLLVACSVERTRHQVTAEGEAKNLILYGDADSANLKRRSRVVCHSTFMLMELDKLKYQKKERTETVNTVLPAGLQFANRG